MGMTIDDTIKRYKNNAEYERTHGNLQGCLEFRQLAEWLEQLQKIQKIINNAKDSDGAVKYNWLYEQIGEVVEDGNDG